MNRIIGERRETVIVIQVHCSREEHDKSVPMFIYDN